MNRLVKQPFSDATEEIAFFTRTIESMSKRERPGDWALAHMNFGAILVTCRNADPIFRERGIEYSTEALTVRCIHIYAGLKMFQESTRIGACRQGVAWCSQVF